MNERIRELADRASDTSDYGLECVTDKFLEHFAELIIRECSKAIFERNARFEPAPEIYILKYFGIKE